MKWEATAMQDSTSVSRRTLTKGVAWTVPVVAVGMTAPSASASPAACAAVVLSSSCTAVSATDPNQTSSPTFCVTPGIAVQPNSTFVVAASGVVLSALPNPSGTLLNYGNFTSISGTAATFTTSTTIPAGTTACLTLSFTVRFTGTLTLSFSARNINGGADCVGKITTVTQNGNRGGKSSCS